MTQRVNLFAVEQHLQNNRTLGHGHLGRKAEDLIVYILLSSIVFCHPDLCIFLLSLSVVMVLEVAQNIQVAYDGGWSHIF